MQGYTDTMIWQFFENIDGLEAQKGKNISKNSSIIKD